MPDPTDELITILMAIIRDPSLARPSGRLRPLLVGMPHPKRRMGRWMRPGIVKISRRFNAVT